MKSAYNELWLHNLQMVKETKQWMKSGFISKEQFQVISDAHPSSFFHPNIFIRILLFIGTLIALSGITGLLALFVSDAGESVYPVLSVIYGVISFFVVDRVFVDNLRHYKSGLNEALIYHSTSFVIFGVCWMSDFSTGFCLIFSALFCAAVAYRYLDLILTTISILCFASWIFYGLNESGTAGQQALPIVFMIVFSAMYFVTKKLRASERSYFWDDCLIIMEAISLIFVYAAGNYFVVRELTINMLGLYLEEGQDIPMAFLFYVLTAIIPSLYLYFAIKRRDIILLRVSLLALAFSVFTFKYYFSLGMPEITFTIAGAFLIISALLISRYLRSPKNGFTREQVLSEKWADANPEAFIISQTLGGNQIVADESFKGGGGEFGGGGATGSF